MSVESSKIPIGLSLKKIKEDNKNYHYTDEIRKIVLQSFSDDGYIKVVFHRHIDGKELIAKNEWCLNNIGQDHFVTMYNYPAIGMTFWFTLAEQAMTFKLSC